MLSPARFVLTSLLAATALFAQTSPPANTVKGPEDPQEFAAFIDSFITPKMEEAKIPGIVFALVKDGELFFSKGYGYADLEKKIPADPAKTAYYIGSNGKLFTTTALLQLADGGRIDLNADINQYLDLFQLEDTYPQPITAWNLLTHTGGFDDGVLEMLAPTAEQIIPLGQYLKRRMPPRVMPPGDLISYSNNGMALAGYLVEVRSGMPYAQYINQQVLQPLGMRRSRAELVAPITETLATGYEYDGASAAFRPVPLVFLNASPAGSIYTTAEDMAHFMIAHLQQGQFKGKTILSQATALEMQRQQFSHDGRIPGVCYGFFERVENGQRLLMHGGALYGYFSFIFLVPDHNLGFFFSCNIFSPALGNMSWEILRVFFDRYFPAPQPLAAAPTSSPRALEQVVGHYQTTRTSQHSLVKLASLAGQIEVEATAEGNLLLHMLMNPQIEPWRPVDHLLFKQDLTDELAAFKADEAGRITHLFMQNFAFERISWYQARSVQLGLLGFSLLMFLSAALPWPIGYLIRRLRPRPNPCPPYATWARILVGAISSLNLVFLIGLVINQDKLNLEIGFGIPTVIYLLLLVALLAALLAIPVLPLTFRLWRHRAWSTLARVHYSLVVLGILIFILFLHYWNLLGIKD